MPKTHRPLTALLLLCWLGLACLAPRAQAQDAPAVVDWLPASFDSAILVPDLGALDGGLAAFESATDLGADDLRDAVGRFQRELGLMHGVDTRGGMAIVAIEAGPRPIAVLLIAVSDHEALAQSLGTEPGDLVAINLPGGSSGYMRKMDGYAVLGGSRQVVQAYTPAGDGAALAERIGPMAARVITESQFSYLANTGRADADAITAEFTAQALQMMALIDPLIAYDLAPAERLPAISALSGLVVSGTDTAVLGASFDATGIHYAEAYKLKPGGAMAGMFPGGAAEADALALLAKLPDDPAVFAVAGDPQAVGLAELADRLGGLLGLDARHALGSVKPVLETLYAQADGVATAYYTLPNAGQVASRWMNTATVFETGDAEQFAEALEAAVLALADATIPVAGSDEAVTFETTYDAEDRLLGGVRYDTFTVKMHLPEAMQTDPKMRALAILGEIGFIGQAAVIDGHVVVTTFDDLSVITRVIETVQSGNGMGRAGAMHEGLAAAMSDGASMVGTLDLRGIADSLSPLLSVLGRADAVQVDPGTRPIAYAIATGENEASVRLFVPSSAVTAMIDEDFDPFVQADNTGTDPGPGPGRELGQPGRGTPGTQPGRTPPGRNPGVRPGRDPGSRPGRSSPGRSPR
jgi:hypothetical protein